MNATSSHGACRPGPWLKRRTYRKTSHLHWDSRGIGMYAEGMLMQHISAIEPDLRALFEQNRAALPRNSELWPGRCWVYCPNAIADQAEALVKRAHAEFLAAGYEEETLFQADFDRTRAERRRSWAF